MEYATSVDVLKCMSNAYASAVVGIEYRDRKADCEQKINHTTTLQQLLSAQASDQRWQRMPPTIQDISELGGGESKPSNCQEKAPDLYTHSRVEYRTPDVSPNTGMSSQFTHKNDR